MVRHHMTITHGLARYLLVTSRSSSTGAAAGADHGRLSLSGGSGERRRMLPRRPGRSEATSNICMNHDKFGMFISCSHYFRMPHVRARSHLADEAQFGAWIHTFLLIAPLFHYYTIPPQATASTEPPLPEPTEPPTAMAQAKMNDVADVSWLWTATCICACSACALHNLSWTSHE